MAKTSSIDQKDEKTKKAIKKALVQGVSVRKIARQNATTKDAVQRYKPKVRKAVAKKAAADQEYLTIAFEELVTMAVKTLKRLDALEDLIHKQIETGGMNQQLLSQFLAVVNTLRPMLLEVGQITGNIKETAQAQAAPTVILAKIQQVIQQNGGDKNAIITALDSLR